MLDDTQAGEAQLTAESGRHTSDVSSLQRAEGHRHVSRHRRTEYRTGIGVDARWQIDREDYRVA